MHLQLSTCSIPGLEEENIGNNSKKKCNNFTVPSLVMVNGKRVEFNDRNKKLVWKKIGRRKINHMKFGVHEQTGCIEAVLKVTWLEGNN